MSTSATQSLVGVLYHTCLTLVREPGRDLTARQITVFLTCLLQPEPQTPRNLTSRLGVSPPAICHALDKLERLDLVERRTDPRDRRSVVILPRPAGWALLQRIQDIVVQAAAVAASNDIPDDLRGTSDLPATLGCLTRGRPNVQATTM